MSLIGCNNNSNNYVKENLNNKVQDPVNIFPEELVLKIFSYLNFATLEQLCLVNKKWQCLASDDRLWRKEEVYEKAISNKKWAQWFGEDAVKDEDFKEEWASLPWNIAGILESPCPSFPGKRVVDTHMLVRLPKTLKGGLTLKNLNELASNYFSASKFLGYSKELENKSIDKSRWVLMTKCILLNSGNKCYEEQQKTVAELAKKSLKNYEVPEVLEAVTCILSQYFDLKICLFDDTVTRCKDIITAFDVNDNASIDSHTNIGNFTLDIGLCVDFEPYVYYNSQIGVAALRKF